MVLITDFDGVWTDGSFTYSQGGGVSWRIRYNDLDVIRKIRKRMPIYVISGSNRPYEVIAKNIDPDLVYVNVDNKSRTIDYILKDRGISWDEVFYIGDGFSDIDCLINAGKSYAPCDSPQKVKDVADCILDKEKGIIVAFAELEGLI